jgi:hypothetical protein
LQALFFLSLLAMPSSVVSNINYDINTAILRITYVSGTIYDYLDVPEDVYTEMKKAFSKGTYLNLHIKGKYSFRKIN